MTEEKIDLASLIEDGHLDLEGLFQSHDWKHVEDITEYTACAFGEDGTAPGMIEIVLLCAEAYGITAYRWAEKPGGGYGELGPPTLDRSEAIEGGKEYAEENDESPDVDELIGQIVATKFFGDADADDIREICEAASGHSQGYLLLPVGRFVGSPVSRMWTTNGYLECPHISLPADSPNEAYAADALLRIIRSAQAEPESH